MSAQILASADLLELSPVIPVVVLEDEGQAVPVANALARGGIGVIEITLRSSAAMGAIKRVAAEVVNIVVGAGTVTTPEQAIAARRAGAQFLVTPGTTPELFAATCDVGLPVLAGASTMSEMMWLAERGLTSMKFFPSEASGGRAFLSAVSGPMPELRFCPTGGISRANASAYLALPNVRCVGGSWLTPREAVQAHDWNQIEGLASDSAKLAAAS